MAKVKICGITNIEDALLSARFGADMVGFNFYRKSPRYLEPGAAVTIIRQLPRGMPAIGVFVNESADRVRQIAESIGLDAVQLHGDETAEYVNMLTDLKVIKAFRISNDFDERELFEYDVDSILVDAFCADEFGGTGKLCDWNTARRIAAKHPKTYLSGGLSHENIREAIGTVRPFAVDACSSLESAKGKKDPEKLERFISAAKTAL